MKPLYLVITGIILILLLAAFACYLLIDMNHAFIKSSIAGGLGDAIDRSVKIDGDLAIKFQLPLTVSLQDVRIQNASWGSAPEMARIQQLDVKIGLLALLFGDLRIHELTLKNADILLETSEKGAWNFDLQATGNRSPVSGQTSVLAAADVEKIRLKKSRLVYRHGRSRKRYQIDIAGLTADIGRHGGPISLKAQFAYRNLPFSVNGSLQPADALMSPHKPLKLRLKADSGSNSLSIDGNIQHGDAIPVADLEFDLKCDKPAQLERIMDYPLTALGNLRASGHFKNEGLSTLRFFQLKLTCGKNILRGRIAVETSAKSPDFKANLNADYLDIREFISTGLSQSNQTEGRLFTKRPLNFKLLSTANADIRFKAERLLLPYLAADNVAATLSLKNGRLTLNPIEADLEGGNLAGDATVSANNQVPAIDVKLRIKSLDLAAMLADLGITDVLKGSAGVDLDFQGRGDSPAAIMAGLNGQITMVVRDGRIAAQYLKKAEKFNLDLASNFLKIFKYSKEKKDFADVNCFVARFKVNDGIADCKVLVFDTDKVGVVGDGDVNLKTEHLNISLKPIEKGGIGISGVGKVKVGLGGLANAYKLSGTLVHPVVSVDESEAALSTAITLGKAIGGTLLFGPAGLAAALVGANFGSDNPCISALKEASKEEKAQSAPSEDQHKKPNE